MPDEAEPHKRTWMAFGAGRDVWGKKLLAGAQRNLASIARAIAHYEPVTMLVREDQMQLARDLAGPGIELRSCPLDDLWIRDSGPVFVTTAKGDKAAIDFNFNGWGNKQEHGHDALVARQVAVHAGAPLRRTKLVLEGGGVEVDGHGSAIITESCVLNANRNPGLGKAAVEATLKHLLGLTKVIWLPGIAGHDITDGHTDFYARFARPGVVLAAYDPDPKSFDHEVTRRHLEILRATIDGTGRRLHVEVLQAPSSVREKFDSSGFAAGYLNFYVCNGAVIAPQFGDLKADRAAREALARLYPKRAIVQLDIDAIAAGGGGIHCTTQQEPA